MEDWGQVLPNTLGPARVSLNPTLDNTGLRGHIGGGWGSGLPGASALLAQWVLRGIRRAKGCTHRPQG